MPKAIGLYVRGVDRVTGLVGRVAMYLVFAMMGLLLFSSIDRLLIKTYPIWIVETTEFFMTGYYFLAGAYSLQLNGHVRMDLLYGRMSARRRALLDLVTVVTLVFYLVVLLLGGIASTEYALTTDQRNFSAWGPPLAPIKAVMTAGIALMLLQTTALLFRDVAELTGRRLE